MPYHIALDNARETHRGAAAIGTTGNGIGPTYEDKVARRGLRVGDLLDETLFSEKLQTSDGVSQLYTEKLLPPRSC